MTDQRPVAELTEDEALAELSELADLITTTSTTIDTAYARRLAIYEHLRGQESPTTFGRISEAAKVSEVAVIQALRKDEERRKKAAAKATATTKVSKAKSKAR